MEEGLTLKFTLIGLDECRSPKIYHNGTKNGIPLKFTLMGPEGCRFQNIYHNGTKNRRRFVKGCV